MKERAFNSEQITARYLRRLLTPAAWPAGRVSLASHDSRSIV
jgi:hypothetical protein